MTGKLFYDLFCRRNSQFGGFRGKLCPMIRSSRLPRMHQHRSSRRLPCWQRLLLGCYSALFALLLPFICWGALAEPGHPHRTPHFVFADPAPNRPTRSSRNSADDSHGSAHAVATVSTQPAAICYLLADSPVAGRATPMLLLFTILLLLLVETALSGQIDRAAVVCRLQPLLAQARFIAVPLPPPRPLSSAFA